MPDLFFYRDPEEADKEERERQEAAEAARYNSNLSSCNLGEGWVREPEVVVGLCFVPDWFFYFVSGLSECYLSRFDADP